MVCLIETFRRLLTSDLPSAPLIVPVGLNAVGLNIKENFQVSLLEQTTWPTLWGCQSYDFDKIQDTLVDNNIEYIEKENRLSINLGFGSTVCSRKNCIGSSNRSSNPIKIKLAKMERLI